MDREALAVIDNQNRQGLEAKLAHAFKTDTPSRPRRSEVEGCSLAADIVSHAAVRKRLPIFLEDRTRLTSAYSTVVLGDGKGQAAVIACVHVPPGAPAAATQTRLEAAGRLAEALATLRGEQGGEGAVAYGVASNTTGLQWAVPPAGWRMPGSVLAPPGGKGSGKAGAKGGLWRWAAAAAAAVVGLFGARR